MVGVVLKISKKSLSGLAQVEVDELPQCLAAINIGLCNTIFIRKYYKKRKKRLYSYFLYGALPSWNPLMENKIEES